jgi:hypothetical protein
MSEEVLAESKLQEEFQKDVTDMPMQPQDMSTSSSILDRDLIEGRDRGEGEVASWFYNSNWPLLLARIPNKGYGMMSRRAIEADEVIFSCPPYVCVPYETRKSRVCAYCYKFYGDPKPQDPPSQPPPPPPTTDSTSLPSASATTPTVATDTVHTAPDNPPASKDTDPNTPQEKDANMLNEAVSQMSLTEHNTTASTSSVQDSPESSQPTEGPNVTTHSNVAEATTTTSNIPINATSTPSANDTSDTHVIAPSSTEQTTGSSNLPSDPAGVVADATASDPLSVSTSPTTAATTTTDTVVNHEEEGPVPCPGCYQVWYCNSYCQERDAPLHVPYECRALAALDVQWAREYYHYCDDLITDVRLLLRAMHRRKVDEEMRLSMATAEGSERGPEELSFDTLYSVLISNKTAYGPEVLDSLRGVVQFANWLAPDEAQVDEELLLDIYCKHRVNMFGIWGDQGECLGYGVYPQASLFNHSCWPNTTFYRNPETEIPFMEFVSVYPIESESEVCISYIDINTDLATRRHTLLDKYFFHCTCERCTYQEQNPHLPDPYFDPTYYYAQNESDQMTQNNDTMDVSDNTQNVQNTESVRFNDENTEPMEGVTETTTTNVADNNAVSNGGGQLWVDAKNANVTNIEQGESSANATSNITKNAENATSDTTKNTENTTSDTTKNTANATPDTTKNTENATSDTTKNTENATSDTTKNTENATSDTTKNTANATSDTTKNAENATSTTANHQGGSMESNSTR